MDNKIGYSIEFLIQHPEYIHKIKLETKRLNARFLAPIISEATYVISGSSQLDADFLNYLSEKYYYRLTDKAPYPHFPEFDNPTYRHFNIREIDQLYSGSEPVIDSPYFAFLALKRCLDALNLLEKDRDADITCMFGEASEAIGMSRIASLCVNVSEEYNQECYLPRKKKKIKQRQDAMRGAYQKNKLEKIKTANTMKDVMSLCKKVWKQEPYIPVGIMASSIEKAIGWSTKKSNDHFLPANAKLIKRLRTIAPQTAIYNGRPKKNQPLSGKTSKEKQDLTNSLIKDLIKGYNLPT